VRRYDDQLGQAFLECDYSWQVFAVALRICIGPSAGDPRALLALRDSFQLPYEVANKRVARSVGQHHQYDHAAGSVTERRYLSFVKTSAETKDETAVDREGLNPILASTQGEDLEDRNPFARAAHIYSYY
jgi:hypothetical protein